MSGDPRAPETRALLREVFGRYLPNAVLACGVDADVPLLEGKKQDGGRPTAYVCRGRTCKAPVVAPVEFAVQLDEP